MHLQTKGKTCTKAVLSGEACDCISIDIEDAKSFENLLDTANAQGVVYAISEAKDSPNIDNIKHSIKQNCQGALLLAQALIKQANLPQLLLATCGAQRITGTEQLAIAQTPLLSMGKTISLEHPELNCRCLDLDPGIPLAQRVEAIAAEIETIQTSLAQVAYRQKTSLSESQRYVENIAPIATSGVNQQLQISTRGTLEQLHWKSVLRRAPEAREVEISVQATGLNFRDVLNALGLYPGDAGALGLECVGEVVAVGADVKTVALGDVVMAIAPASFAQFVTVSAELVTRKPANLSAEEAATIPTAFLTAYYALQQIGQLKAGESVLIHSAAGGVGQAAVQIAQQVGAIVFATASPPKWDRLKAQGVQYIFNSRTLAFAQEIEQQTQGGGVNLILNSLSGEFIEKSLSVLSPEGRFIEIGKAGIWSPAQMAQHRPDVTYQIIDLVAVTVNQPSLIQSMLGAIAQQLQQNKFQPLPSKAFKHKEAIDAFRFMQQAKHIGKVVVLPPDCSDKSNQPAIRPDATYLITGGMGGLGLQLARWLVDEGAMSLLLMGRRSPSNSAQQIIQELTRSGTHIQIVQADLADSSAVEQELSPILKSSPPLKGVFHLAGQIDDGILQQQTWKAFEQVMTAKVDGTWNLHELTRSLDLDHFVLFSSAASLVGSAGQVNYAAANGFLDAIAHHRQQQGLPALSLNWGAWAGSGLATSSAVKQRLAKMGVPAIQPESGFAALGHVLRSYDKAQVGVLPGNLRSWRQHIYDSSQSTKPSSPIKLQIQAVENPETLVSDHLLQQLSIVLGVKSTSIQDLSSTFTELGMDSLTAVELRNRLQTSLECALPATLIYDHPTPALLRDYLVNQLAPTSSQPSEQRAPSDSHQQPDGRNEELASLSESDAEALLIAELEQLEG